MIQNKTPAQSFCDNFGERGPILITLSRSPLHSAMNAGRSFYIICHLTSNLLPHYLMKFECSTEQPFTMVIQFKSVHSHLCSVNICWYVIVSMTCLCRFIYNVTACRVFKIPGISTQVCFESCTRLVDGCVDDALFNAEPDAVPIYCADVTSNDVTGTNKRQLC